jgi:hypothetical protein
MTRSSGQAPDIFISRRAAATTTTTNRQQRTTSVGRRGLVREKTYSHRVARWRQNDKVKRTCYASNIDATTSQATSNLDAHELS